MNALFVITPLFLFCSFSPLKAQSNEDSLLVNLEMQEISQQAYEQAEAQYRQEKNSDYDVRLSELGLSLLHHCDEICEAYLVEDSSGEMMFLPSDFDSGIMGLLFSTSGNRLLIYSSYDGPDYVNYYEDRAEIIAYSITGEKGLHAIKPLFTFYTQDWSIEDLVWVNDATIALKTYEGSKNIREVEGGYKYFKAIL